MDPTTQGNSEVVPGRRFRYGHWLQPLINPNLDQSSPEAVASEEAAPVPERRGRGRPRVSAVRDASAIEVCLISRIKLLSSPSRFSMHQVLDTLAYDRYPCIGRESKI